VEPDIHRLKINLEKLFCSELLYFEYEKIAIVTSTSSGVGKVITVAEYFYGQQYII